MREFCLVGVFVRYGWGFCPWGFCPRGFCPVGFLSVSRNISLYTKIMTVNIITIYTIFKLRLFPTIHCKWHQILVKFQKLLGEGGGLHPPPQAERARCACQSSQ